MTHIKVISCRVSDAWLNGAQPLPKGLKVHISSIVVHVDPAAAAHARAQIDALPGLQTHAASDDGKLVVTIEAPSEGESMQLMNNVNALPGVLAVAMVFHQCEADPEMEI